MLIQQFKESLAVVALTCLLAAAAHGQSSDRNRSGAQPSDLELSGPANDVGNSDRSKVDIPPVDDFIAQGASQKQSADTSQAGDTTPIPDLDRQPAPASQAPSLPAETGTSHSNTAMKPAEGSSELERRVARLEQLIEAQSATLAEMAKIQAQMLPAEELKKIREELVALRNSFQTVARPDLGGTTTPQARGKLVVENLTGVGYTMNINGFDFLIWPGRREFNVPIGAVVTELRGFEAPRSWNAENFKQVGEEQHLAIQIQ